MTPDDDPKVKELLTGGAAVDGRDLLPAGSAAEGRRGSIDATTQADLARWFGLPSFSEVAERPLAPEDPEVAAVRERRAKATAAVDPALLERIRIRTEERPETLIKFAA